MAQTELRQRIISGIILGAVVIALTLWSFESFAAMCAVGFVILMKEWWNLTKQRSRIFLPLGILYISAAIASLVLLRAIDISLILLLFGLVWGSDIGAYFVGKKWGNHKIAPSISPGKSWEGLAGGMIVCALIGFCVHYTGEYDQVRAHVFSQDFQSVLIHKSIWWALGCMPFAVIGLAGDMFESSLKRRAGVKDSGTLIPGHGGLFDRVDALMPCAITVAGLFVGQMFHGYGH
jgi:phosphatidate cytidylyltransferase